MIVEALTYVYGTYNRWRLNRVIDKMIKNQLRTLANMAEMEKQLHQVEQMGRKDLATQLNGQIYYCKRSLIDADAVISEIIEFRKTL
jgi:hypothetical protein